MSDLVLWLADHPPIGLLVLSFAVGGLILFDAAWRAWFGRSDRG